MAQGLPDTAALSGLPRTGIVIEGIQPPELLLEQWPDLLESDRWPDLGVEPRKSPPVTASSARSSLSRTSCHTRLSSSMITDPAITSAPLDSRHPGGRSFQISVAHRPSPAAEALSWDIMRRSR